MHCLIIEDEYLIALDIEDCLRTLGYTSFLQAATAKSAIQAHRAKAPDLITADFNLAVGTGVDAVLAIGSEPAVPVIFITGQADAVKAVMPDATIVDKPVSCESVEAAIIDAMRKLAMR